MTVIDGRVFVLLPDDDSLGDTNKYWEEAMRQISSQMSPDDCIESITIRAHGANFGFGQLLAKRLKDSKNGQSTFLDGLKGMRCKKTCIIDVQACSVAAGAQGKTLISEVAVKTGFTVRAWDGPVRGFNHYGKQWEADPSGKTPVEIYDSKKHYNPSSGDKTKSLSKCCGCELFSR